MVFESCHGGVGKVTGRELFTKEDSKCGFNFMHDTSVPVGGTIGLHKHFGNEEVYYLLEGEGEMVLDGVSYPMRPGDVSMVSGGHTHKIINVGHIPLRIIVVEAGDATECENIPE